MNNDLIEAYRHKTVQLKRRNLDVNFQTSLGLFSSNIVDVGSNLLLRVIAEQADGKFKNCLDIGCGYGVLGISLAVSGIAGQVEFVDRDALAVEFTRLNAGANSVNDAEVHGSLGLADVSSESYDLIVSNLPGKAGSAVLHNILSASAAYLSEDGQFWGVVVSPLWPEIAGMLDDLRLNTLHIEQGSRHVVFGFTAPATGHTVDTTDPLSDVYSRDSVDFVVQRKAYTLRTSRGVAEFDGLSYSTQLLLEQLYEMRRERKGEAVVFNVGQGYVPLALKASRMARSLLLVDRDLLALRTTIRNLKESGMDDPRATVHHQVDWLPGEPDERYGFIAGTLRGDETQAALDIGFKTIGQRLAPGGTAVIAGGSTPITRALKLVDAEKGVHLVARSRNKGSSVAVFRKAV